jgi:hypothetical protein
MLDCMRRCCFALVFALGCASTQQPSMQRGAESAGDSVSEMNGEPMTGGAGRRPTQPPSWAPAPPSTPPPAAGATRVIERGDLDAVLAQSPGYFLQHVETKPQFRDGRFFGWRLVSFFPGDDRFAGVDLHAGDVVTRVNGTAIEQPDQFMAVWSALRASKELVVDVERDGAPRRLRWQIRDR